MWLHIFWKQNGCRQRRWEHGSVWLQLFHVTLPVCATKRGGSSWHSPNLPQRAHRSLLAIFGVTMMQTPHPSADVPAYEQSPRETRLDSGCWIHGWQHCLSLHLPLSLSSVQVELCAHWTCKCSWDHITKVLGKNSVGFCAKNQFTWQQPWPQHVLPLAGLVLGIITACTWESTAAQSWKCTRDQPQKYNAIQQHLTWTVSMPSGARKSFCTIL